MDNKHWLCSELKRMREEAGYSASALASFTQTTEQNIYSFEQGRTYPSLKIIEKWLNFLGYEMDIHKIDPI